MLPPPIFPPPPLPRNPTPEMRRAHNAAIAEYRKEVRAQEEFAKWMFAAFMVFAAIAIMGFVVLIVATVGAKASIGTLLVIGLAWVATYQVKQRL